MQNITIRDYDVISKTPEWKSFWNKWYNSDFSKDKGSWGVGPYRTYLVTDNISQLRINDVLIYLKYKNNFIN